MSTASEERQTLHPGFAQVMARYGKVNESCNKMQQAVAAYCSKLIPIEFREVFAMQG
jgi:hypothetical protein